MGGDVHLGRKRLLAYLSRKCSLCTHLCTSFSSREHTAPLPIIRGVCSITGARTPRKLSPSPRRNLRMVHDSRRLPSAHLIHEGVSRKGPFPHLWPLAGRITVRFRHITCHGIKIFSSYSEHINNCLRPSEAFGESGQLCQE